MTDRAATLVATALALGIATIWAVLADHARGAEAQEFWREERARSASSSERHTRHAPRFIRRRHVPRQIQIRTAEAPRVSAAAEARAPLASAERAAPAFKPAELSVPPFSGAIVIRSSPAMAPAVRIAAGFNVAAPKYTPRDWRPAIAVIVVLGALAASVAAFITIPKEGNPRHV